MTRVFLTACLLAAVLITAPAGCSKQPELNPPDAPVIPPGRTKENPGLPPNPGTPAVPTN